MTALYKKIDALDEPIRSRRNSGRKANPVIGVLEWFRPGEHQRVERVVSDLKEIGVDKIRTGVSWADWHTSEGEEWYSWLLPRLSRDLDLLPCFLYTPPSLGIAPKSSSPPQNPKDYADFLDVMITRFGECFDWVELWNEPNNLREWDVTLDPDFLIFCQMIGSAAHWAHQRGKKTVLAGMSPIDPNWLRRMFERGVMDHIDAIGIHGFPDTYEYSWKGWEAHVARIQEVLENFNSSAQIWITEVGFSTWRHDEARQLREFVKAAEAPVDRVYWYAAHDLDPNLPTVDGFHSDEREYHFGLKRPDGAPKLLYRLWETGGLDAVREGARLGVERKICSPHTARPTVITGGSGFIGVNLAHRLLENGCPVLIFDNLSRRGVEENLRWLRNLHGDMAQVEIADVRDPFAVRKAIERASQVFHFAAQVAVTTSLVEPVHDFEVNVRGTINVLEALRGMADPPPLVFTSTNKVYGDLQDVDLRRNCTRYEPVEQMLREHGVSENQPPSFHSPYGCSKGAADQYVLDYARIFGLPTAVFRMSCIYGPHQFGTEDQGWVAHFLIQAIEGRSLILYGDGMQVRDLLYVDDLVDAFLLAQANMDTIRGRAFNIGGGAENTISLIELIDLIQELHGAKPQVRFDDWRTGDQRYYVSDTTRFREATGWAPKVSVQQGVQNLYRWLLESRSERVAGLAAMKGATANAR